MTKLEPTPISGISYYSSSPGTFLDGRDGAVRLLLGDFPLPLLTEDHEALSGAPPTYDAIGRGVYQALRANPDCAYASEYARLLKDAYPHYISELATHVVMLDRKDVEVPYLDRKVNYLKIFALLEPDNPQFPLGIGAILLDKGLHLSALNQSTVSIYQAGKFFRRAHELAPDDLSTLTRLGEVAYLVGRYEEAQSIWHSILAGLDPEQVALLQHRLERLTSGVVPRVPMVDYLEAAAVAFGAYEQGDFEEAAAILTDILEDEVFREEFQVPEIYFILGASCEHLAMPAYAEEYLREALRLRPEYEDALCALNRLKS